MDSLCIISLNCRGLNNSFKRKQTFRFLKMKKANIYCLQDVHFTSEQDRLIKQEWGYNQCYISPHKSNSRGTAILFNNNFEFKVNHTIIDEDNGNFVALDLTINGCNYTVITLYDPNKDSLDFFF